MRKPQGSIYHLPLILSLDCVRLKLVTMDKLEG